MRVVVVGTGIAGLIAALRASRRHEVVLVTKSELAESNTKYAQGGIAAALFPDDSVAAHVADTLAAGAGLADPIAVEVLCGEGPQRVRDLVALGVAFDRESDAPDAALARGHEAAHSHRRVVHAGGDATGLAIEVALLRAVRRIAVEVHEHTFLRDLIVVGEGAARRVAGVEVRAADGRERSIAADAVVLATGGAGQLYRHSTNPEVATGDGIAAAVRAGAVVQDLEFYQFHPTSLAVPGNPLVSEAVRGEGAVLLDESGRRFMLDEHPDGELAPRDVVARGIARAMARQGGRPVLLDATRLGAAFLAERFPSISRAVARHGIDWAREPVPVTPAAHYWMGGIRTDTVGRSTLAGLVAVGEASCTGVHGANRLASNSLLESLVFAWRAADALDADAPPLELDPASVVALPRDPARPSAATPSPRDPARPSAATPSETQDRTLATSGDPGSTAARPFDRPEFQTLMWERAGLERDAAGLRAAAARLDGWHVAGDAVADLEDRNLLELGRLLVAAALRREESRGAHFRTDFPDADPALAHSVAWVRPTPGPTPRPAERPTSRPAPVPAQVSA